MFINLSVTTLPFLCPVKWKEGTLTPFYQKIIENKSLIG